MAKCFEDRIFFIFIFLVLVVTHVLFFFTVNHKLLKKNYSLTKFDKESYYAVVSQWKKYSSKMNWKEVDILSMEPPKFLPDYRNPCYLSSPSNISSIKCLPYFMVIGMTKCGTTDFFYNLQKHQDIVPFKYKEIFWFDMKRLDGETLDHYANYFNEILKPKYDTKKVIIGEASTSTMWNNYYWMDTKANSDYLYPKYINPHLIKHIMPNTKFIIIVRDPVKRLFSDYNYFSGVTYNATAQGFHTKVVEAVRWLMACFNSSLNRRHCLYDIESDDRAILRKRHFKGIYGCMICRMRIGLYSEFLKDWFQVFPREQFLIITLEDYSQNRQKLLSRAYTHLNLDTRKVKFQDNKSKKERLNAREPSIKMLKETRLLLQNFYKPFNKELGILMNKTFYEYY